MTGPDTTWCPCGREACDGCQLEREHDESEGQRPDVDGDESDCMEGVRVAHRGELAKLLERAGRTPEQIARAIENTRKPSRAA